MANRNPRYVLRLGQHGMNLNTNTDDLPAGSLEVAENITLYENSIQKDFGESAINSTSLGAKVAAGVDYFVNPETQRQVVYSNTDLKKTSGVGNGSFSDINTTLTADQIGQFIKCGNETGSDSSKLIFCNGTDRPQLLTADGTSTTDVGSLGSFTDILDFASGDATMTVNITAHGLQNGSNVTLEGFDNPTQGQNPNVTNASVTVVDANSFTVELSGNASGTASGTGGTGTVLAHPVAWTSTTQPEGGVLHNNRVILYLRHLIYASDDEDHNRFQGSDAYFYPVRTDIGNEIRSAASFLGRLVIWKHPYGIFHMKDPAASTVDGFDFQTITTRSGIAGKNAYTQAGPYLYYLTPDAEIERILPTDGFDSLRHEQLSTFFNLNDYLRDTLEPSLLEEAVMSFDTFHKEIIICAPKSGEGENNFQIKINVSDPDNPKFVTADRSGGYASLWNQRDSNNKERVVSGTSSGFLLDITNETRSLDSGSATFDLVFPVVFTDSFESKFKTVDVDFSDQFRDAGDRLKQIESIEPVFDFDTGDINWDINIYADGRLVDTVNFYKAGSQATFTLTFPVTFRDDTIQNDSRDVLGAYGKRFSFEGINRNANENSKISKIYVRFRVGDERNF